MIFLVQKEIGHVYLSEIDVRVKSLGFHQYPVLATCISNEIISAIGFIWQMI